MPCDHEMAIRDRHRYNPSVEPDHARFPSGAQIPHPHRGIEAAADHDQAPVQLPDGHRPNHVGVAAERIVKRRTRS